MSADRTDDSHLTRWLLSFPECMITMSLSAGGGQPIRALQLQNERQGITPLTMVNYTTAIVGLQEQLVESYEKKRYIKRVI